ncbi:hypothetical protein MKEN_01299600 [Mycena kentingensis (nom. inval.)]|nr:hypothetical protein MKEN_01299600 [Mycena kentingensis (nom. inval.)]
MSEETPHLIISRECAAAPSDAEMFELQKDPNAVRVRMGIDEDHFYHLKTIVATQARKYLDPTLPPDGQKADTVMQAIKAIAMEYPLFQEYEELWPIAPLAHHTIAKDHVLYTVSARSEKMRRASSTHGLKRSDPPSAPLDIGTPRKRPNLAAEPDLFGGVDDDGGLWDGLESLTDPSANPFSSLWDGAEVVSTGETAHSHTVGLFDGVPDLLDVQPVLEAADADGDLASLFDGTLLSLSDSARSDIPALFEGLDLSTLVYAPPPSPPSASSAAHL